MDERRVEQNRAAPLAPSIARPVLAVVAREKALTDWLAAVCDALSLTMRAVPDTVSLAITLAEARPVGIVCGDLGEQGRPVATLLRLLAGYDRALPVLLMTADEPETLGSVDAAIDLWPLENVERVAMPVPVSAVLGFLARAGHREGSVHMLQT